MTFIQRLTGSLLLLALSTLGTFNVHAHELRPAVADIRSTPAALQISLRVNLEALISEIGAEHQDSDDAPQTERYQQLRAMAPDALAMEFQDYLPTLLHGIALRSTGDSTKALPLSLSSLDIPPVDDIRLPRDSRLVLETPAVDSISALTWQWADQFGSIILRADGVVNAQNAEQAPTTLALDEAPAMEDKTDARSQAFSQYLQPGELSDPISIDSGVEQTGGSSFLDYVVIGFEHIIPKGLDHILFVIGLFLLAPTLKPIVWQVSMFTIAHTVTLALGITGVIALPPSVVEPLIALSITVICIENLLGGRFSTLRLALVFGFGLLHGLGFAGVLSDIGLVSGRFASSLVAFNIGVELGQLSVVFLCFAVAGWWFGNKPWYRQRITIPASLIIGAIGLFWFLQRVQIIA